jgi:hypothetical protein
MELSRQEEALIDTLRFLGADYAKDLYYQVMSGARKAIQDRELEKGELEKLKEVHRVKKGPRRILRQAQDRRYRIHTS